MDKSKSLSFNNLQTYFRDFYNKLISDYQNKITSNSPIDTTLKMQSDRNIYNVWSGMVSIEKFLQSSLGDAASEGEYIFTYYRNEKNSQVSYPKEFNANFNYIIENTLDI